MQLQEAVSILFPDSTDRDFFIQNPNPEILKRAFRTLAREVHPDLNDGRSHERFVQLNKAYNNLIGLPLNELKRFVAQKQTSIWHFRSRNAVPRPQHNPVDPNALNKIDNQYRQSYRHAPNPHSKKIPKYKPTTEEVYFSGEVPNQKLQLGMYLYYSKHISFQMLAHALAWQRDLRPKMGTLAKAWQWLEDEDIDWILQSTSIPGRFAERAYRMGYLSQQQFAVLIRQQRIMQTPFGQYFLANAILSISQLNKALRDLSSHNASVHKDYCKDGSLG
jgi:hypothetical protein